MTNEFITSEFILYQINCKKIFESFFTQEKNPLQNFFIIYEYLTKWHELFSFRFKKINDAHLNWFAIGSILRWIWFFTSIMCNLYEIALSSPTNYVYSLKEFSHSETIQHCRVISQNLLFQQHHFINFVIQIQLCYKCWYAFIIWLHIWILLTFFCQLLFENNRNFGWISSYKLFWNALKCHRIKLHANHRLELVYFAFFYYDHFVALNVRLWFFLPISHFYLQFVSQWYSIWSLRSNAFNVFS